MDKLSFKERVAQVAIEQAKQYKISYADCEYLICSKAFRLAEYYIISAHEDNFRHLLGVNTTLSAQAFFNKCIDGTLTENDFDFAKFGRSEKQVKGTIRRKLKALPAFVHMMERELVVQETFRKNQVCCSFATTDGDVTAGFICAGKSKPMTLLNGDELDWAKAECVDLILRRRKGTDKFDELVFGNEEAIEKYKDKIVSFLAEEFK